MAWKDKSCLACLVHSRECDECFSIWVLSGDFKKIRQEINNRELEDKKSPLTKWPHSAS